MQSCQDHSRRFPRLPLPHTRLLTTHSVQCEGDRPLPAASSVCAAARLPLPLVWLLRRRRRSLPPVGGGDSSQLMSGVWGGRGTAVGQEAGCGRDGGGAWLDPLDMGRGSSRGRQAVQGLVGRGRGLPGGWSQPVCLPSWASVVGAARSAAASPEAAAATGSTSSSSERLRPHRHLVGCAGAHAGDARRRRQHRLRRDGARCPLTPPRQPTAEACPAALPRCPAERCVSGGVGRWCEAPSGPTAGPLGGTLGSRGLGGGRGADPHVSALG